MMPLLAIAVLAAITYALRIAGPLLADRVTVPAAAQRLFTSAAAVLLVALAATSALTTGHDFAGWARPAGVAAAGLLAARRAPFPVVVVVAASVTALLRLAGIQLSERARGASTPVRLSAYQSTSPAAPAPGVPRPRSRTLRFSCCYQRFRVISAPKSKSSHDVGRC
jgi:branched-subunit amino acid transport protein